MPISRLRLRLTFWFGAAFLLGLLVLDGGFLLYTHRKGTTRLARETAAQAVNLTTSMLEERDARPDASLDDVVGEVLGEWPPGPELIAVFDSSGRRLGARGDSARLAMLDGYRHNTHRGTLMLPLADDGALRVAWNREAARGRPVLVVAATSTAALQEDQEILVGWLLLSLPLIGLSSAGAGYAMARRALTPVQAMARELDTIDPERIDHRLPVGNPADELDQLSTHFNGLLERLARARESSRLFLAQAAHQLRTPLTVVRGESALGLDRPRSPEDYLAALRRISLAAEQMSRRVGELFLLAEAQAGERPQLTDRVELDGLVMEAADLMRSRASGLGRTLALGQMDDTPLMGAEALLREAVMELVENACRHGTPDEPIELSVRREGRTAHLEVSNTGPAFPDGASQGLGLPIVRWVAEIHGGSLITERRGERNVVRIDVPIT